MEYTEHLELPTYELTDPANLAGGYNDAMHLIDEFAERADTILNDIPNLTLDDNAVTTPKIANGAVTEEKLANNAVSAAKLDDGSVSTSKIIDGSITLIKLDDDIFDLAPTENSSNLVTSGAVYNYVAEEISNIDIPSSEIEDEAVTTDKLADNAVTASKLANGAVTSSKLTDNAITTAKIGDGNVTLAKLSSDAKAAMKPAIVTVANTTATSATNVAALPANGTYRLYILQVTSNYDKPAASVVMTPDQFANTNSSQQVQCEFTAGSTVYAASAYVASGRIYMLKGGSATRANLFGLP